MSDIIVSDFPIWGLGGDDELDQQASIIAETRQKLKQTDLALTDLEEKLEIIENRANMYIKNIIKVDEYDGRKHMLFIDDKYKATLFQLEEYQSIIESGEEIDITDRDFIQLTRKQADKIVSIMWEYDDLAEEYEDFMESYEDLSSYHDEVWEEATNTLTDFSGLLVYETDTEEVEQFDLEKHILLVIKDENNKWGFRYIRKEDEEEFNKLISEKE